MNTIIENNINEIWKSVPNYEGLYEASNLGNIRSLDRKIPSKKQGCTFLNVKGKVLSPKTDRYGYKCVVLCKDTIKKYFTVHRLIALTFIPNTNNYPEVNHINNNRIDNRSENLIWGSCHMNQFHRHKTWNHIVSNTNPSGRNMTIAMSLAKAQKLNPESVKKIRELYSTGKYTQKQIGKIFGITHKHVYLVVNNKIWKLVT